MAFTQTDIDTLEQAAASGEKRVRFADREVEYRSIDELLRALALARSEVQSTAGTRTRQIHFSTSKGL
jgi:hypothetical protein